MKKKKWFVSYVTYDSYSNFEYRPENGVIDIHPFLFRQKMELRGGIDRKGKPTYLISWQELNDEDVVVWENMDH